MPLRAVVFDVYGTLLRIADPALSRHLPRLLGVERHRFMELVRGPLMTRSFASREELARFLCSALAPGRAAELEAACLAIIERELASVEPLPGARSLVAFLHRRGYAIGFASNLASVHREPVAAHGLAEHADACAYSCEQGRRKPDPEIYLDLARRLGVAPGETLVVGDSLANDVRAPRQLGMHALRVGPGGLETVAALGWRQLDPAAGFPPLVEPGLQLEFAGRRAELCALAVVPDVDQGRYNLVARGRLCFRDSAAGELEVYAKRFLFPEGAHVEELAHRLHAALGLSACQATIVPGPEPCLLVSAAPGQKLHGEIDPALARELGRHCAAAYLLANADLRPRNAFLSGGNARPVVTMVDLEHCFFNLALDVTGLEAPERPQTLDALAPAERAARTKRRVLTERATRRARRSFFETESHTSELARAFRAGWLELYQRGQGEADAILGLLEDRIYREPYLVIGTQAYRRAMARLDVEDIRERLERDPDEVFEACF